MEVTHLDAFGVFYFSREVLCVCGLNIIDK